MTATTTPAPIFFTVPTQVDILFHFEKHIIPRYFNVIDDGDTLCSDIEIGDYICLLSRPRGTALDDDALKHRAANPFFQFIASYLCEAYPAERPQFKRCVSLFRFTARR
jgi:hypothetical protein